MDPAVDDVQHDVHVVTATADPVDEHRGDLLVQERLRDRGHQEREEATLGRGRGPGVDVPPDRGVRRHGRSLGLAAPV